MRSSAVWTVLSIMLLLPARQVDAHGFLAEPRSRNFVAYQDGKWWSPDGEVYPKPESCPHCLNRGGTAGACGIVGDNDYLYPKDTRGEPYVSPVQGVYEEGGLVDIEFTLTAHHKGHVELKACPDAAAPTQDCFDAHPAEFVTDLAYGAPPHPAYPIRGYIAPNDGSAGEMSSSNAAESGMRFKMRYRLPRGVSGDRCVLQWHYVTGNSCSSEGYADYPWPSPQW